MTQILAQHHYRGALQLSTLERVLGGASAILDGLKAAGFIDIAIYMDPPPPAPFGDLAQQGNAWAEATWPGPTQDMALPSQLVAFRDDGSVLAPPIGPVVSPPVVTPPVTPPATTSATINLIPGDDYVASLFLQPAQLAATEVYEHTLQGNGFADVYVYTNEADLDDDFAGVRAVPFANAWVSFTYSKLAPAVGAWPLPPEFLMVQDVTAKTQPPAKTPPGKIPPPGKGGGGTVVPTKKPTGLTTGQKWAIGVGIVVVLAGGATAIYYVTKRPKKNPSRKKKKKAA